MDMDEEQIWQLIVQECQEWQDRTIEEFSVNLTEQVDQWSENPLVAAQGV